jgi:transcription initiation factor IIE alpha subunit
VNLPAEQRCNKLFDAVCNRDEIGVTDKSLAEELGWEVNSVRSTASQLLNKGRVYITKSPKDEWVIFAENQEHDSEPENQLYLDVSEGAIDELGYKIAKAIAEYVQAIKLSRI